LGTALESAQKLQGPAVSVVVVSCNTPRTLEKCLASLASQPAAEVLVIDCSDIDPTETLGPRFRGVTFHHFPDKLSIPEMRREGIRASTREIVALTESWMTPSSNWVAALSDVHRRSPEAAAVGGPVTFPCRGQNATLLAWADYFSEYGEHVPGPAGGAEITIAEKLTGANCSYKRRALEACRDLVDQAAWEHHVHDRLRQQGHTLVRTASAGVCYHRPCPPGELLRLRFAHGRAHAAGRLRESAWIARMARGAAAPLVPWVLLWRQWRAARRSPGMEKPFFAAAAWSWILNTAWALGEAAFVGQTILSVKRA
jgi:hypothetical protein